MLPGFAILRYWTCSRETLYIGISKFICTGPISFLISDAVADGSVILAIKTCSVAPTNLLIVQTHDFS